MARNREQEREHKQQWRADNRERYNTYGRDYRARNRDRFRRYDLRHRYGVTPEWYDKQKALQGGRCAVCGTTDTGDKRWGRFCIDHNHTTGAVRALLCSSCNRVLGLFKESAARLRAAADYLEKHQ